MYTVKIFMFIKKYSKHVMYFIGGLVNILKNMLQKESIKNSFLWKIQNVQKRPIVVESFVIVALFDCDRTHYDSKSKPYFYLVFTLKSFYHILTQQFNSLVLFNKWGYYLTSRKSCCVCVCVFFFFIFP